VSPKYLPRQLALRASGVLTPPPMASLPPSLSLAATTAKEADAKRLASNKRFAESTSWHGDKDKLSADQLLERSAAQLTGMKEHVEEENKEVAKFARELEDAKYYYNLYCFGIDSRDGDGQRNPDKCFAAQAAAGNVSAQERISSLREGVMSAESVYRIHSKHLEFLRFNLRNLEVLEANLRCLMSDKKYAVAGDLVAEMNSIIDAETKKNSLASQELFHDVLAVKTAQQAADDIRAQSAARLDALRAKTATERNAEFSTWKAIPMGDTAAAPFEVK
jgi:hypothetical protein